MRNLRKLEVAERARSLALSVYAVTARFPVQERYGLAAQMRRAAVSVASNIAEGSGRGGEREFIQFLYVALGSARELAVQIELAVALSLLEPTDGAALADHADHIQRMLNRLTASLRKKRSRSRTEVGTS